MNGDFVAAALAVLVAGLLDTADGRVARWTRTESQFGAEYDSLSDMVAFGVAPALVAFLLGPGQPGSGRLGSHLRLYGLRRTPACPIQYQGRQQDLHRTRQSRRRRHHRLSWSGPGRISGLVCHSCGSGREHGPGRGGLCGPADGVQLHLLLAQSARAQRVAYLSSPWWPWSWCLPSSFWIRQGCFSLIALVYAASGPVQHFWRRARKRRRLRRASELLSGRMGPR